MKFITPPRGKTAIRCPICNKETENIVDKDVGLRCDECIRNNLKWDGK